MPRYLIEFERIGRDRVKPVTLTVGHFPELEGEIGRIARHHLRSRDFDVHLDREAGAGWIACGMHSGGNFSITKQS